MQIEGGLGGVGRGPLVGRFPAAAVPEAAFEVGRRAAELAAHDEVADGRLAVEAGFHVLEVVIEEAKAQVVVEGQRGFEAEVHVAGGGFLGRGLAVAPVTEEQRHGAGLAAAESVEVGDGAAGIGVVPAALEEDGDVGVLVPVLVDGVSALGPVGAAAAVGEDVPGPLLVERQEAEGGAAGAEAKRRAEDLGNTIELGAEDALEVGIGPGFLAGDGHAVGVADEALLEGAALTHRGNEVVAGALADELGAEVRRVEGGQGALVGAGVGGAHGADAAVAPGLDRDPLHGVVAVGGFLSKGIPLAAGAAAATNVVDDDRVAATREPVRLAGVAAGVLEIGRALNEGGEP